MKLFVQDGSSFYAPNEVGMTRKLTPEGFLLCEGVRIARTGQQAYAKSELPLKAGTDGLIIVDRPEDEVFDEETIRSFNGKPVTVEHPNEFVSPDTWRQLAVGTVQNTRRGEGDEKEFLVADLLITDRAAIDYVNRELPELSCGYDSDYEQTEAGRATQHNIIGNHVALVDRGRAGPRVAIKDHFSNEVKSMTSKVKFSDRLTALLDAIRRKDTRTVDSMMEEEVAAPNDIGGYGGSEDAMNRMVKDAVDRAMKDAMKRWKDEFSTKPPAKGEGSRGEEESGEEGGAEEKESLTEAEKAAKKAKLEEKAGEAQDTIIEPEEMKRNPDLLGRTWVGDSAGPLLKEILQHAEVLSPGIHVPTTDAPSQGSARRFMVSALLRAQGTADGKDLLAPFLKGRTVDSLSGREVLATFTAAAQLKKELNRVAARPSGIDPAKARTADAKSFGVAKSPAEVQALLDAHYAKSKKTA